MLAHSVTGRYLVAMFGMALSLGLPGEADPPAPFDGDDRLERSVTIERRRICLGQLLEQIGLQTGVRLTVSDLPAPASGYELTAVARKRKARDLLHAITELYNAPPDRWYWARTGDKPNPAYVLRHTLPPQGVRDQRNLEAQRQLRRQDALLAQFYSTVGPARARLLQQNPYLSGFDNPVSKGAYSLIQSLTPAQRDGLISGGRIEIPVSALSPEGRGFLEGYAHQSQNGGSPPEVVSFSYDTQFGPSITFESGAAGGGAALGGAALEGLMSDWERGRWKPELAGAPVRQIENTGEPSSLGRSTPDAALHSLSRRAPIDLLFDHARSTNQVAINLRTPLAGKLGDVLKALEGSGILGRWRYGFALFRERRWSQA